MELLTINEAAQISGKSVQTIRRMIKRRKLRIKRKKTPQGFNYLIDKKSLLETGDDRQEQAFDDTSSLGPARQHRPIEDGGPNPFKREFDRFNMTIQKLIEQNEKDKENFFSLIRTFQERTMELEAKIKLLEAPKKRWWQFWK